MYRQNLYYLRIKWREYSSAQSQYRPLNDFKLMSFYH